MIIHEKLAILDEILDARAEMIGTQFQPYKNHVYRVVNFCFAFYECNEVETQKIIIAGCFHDLGIWPDDSVDYLAPSIKLARDYCDQTAHCDWAEEITQMIDQHHKFRRVKNGVSPLVEVFRKGDWVDASLGLRTFGLSRSFIRQVQAAFPNLGFHNNLARLALKQLRKSPLNPLPMMKW